MSRKNRTPEENERRAKIRELLQMGGIRYCQELCANSFADSG